MCCGRYPSGFAPAPLLPARPTATAPTTFELHDDGPLTMFGRVTGARYHFAARGARVRVDSRDAPVLALVRGLVAVRG